MAQVKGVNLTHTRAFVESAYGLEGWASVAAEMTAAGRAAMDGVVAVGWYPDALHVELLGAIERGLHDRGGELLRRAGAFSAEYDVSRIHRVLFRTLNPGLLLLKTADIWSRYFDSGRWEIERPTSSSVVATLHDFGIVDERYCVYLGGYFQRLFELVGARDVRVRHPRCRARGDASCRFEGDWR